MNKKKMEIKRGEMWYLSAEPFDVSSVQFGRWVVVVNSSFGLTKTSHVICVPCTTQLNAAHKSVNTLINSGDRPRVAQGNMVTTFPIEQFRRKECSVTPDELEKIENTLYRAMGLREDQKQDDTELRVERDLYKRLYEKTLEMLTEKKITDALESEPERVAEETVEVEVVPVEEEVPELSEEDAELAELERELAALEAAEAEVEAEEEPKKKRVRMLGLLGN